MSFSQEDIEYFESWGLNAVRLGFMWPGAETANGTFNQTYLDDALDIVNAAGAGGIYTLIDAHQDILSKKFCGEVSCCCINTEIELMQSPTTGCADMGDAAEPSELPRAAA